MVPGTVHTEKLISDRLHTCNTTVPGTVELLRSSLEYFIIVRKCTYSTYSTVDFSLSIYYCTVATR